MTRNDTAQVHPLALDDQVALVTGGIRGIGLAIGGALAKDGSRVALVDVSVDGGDEALAGLPGEGHQVWAADVTDSGAVGEVVKKVEKEMGGVEIVVNNAGITRDNLLLRMSEEDWDQVLAVNLKGAFNVTKATIRGMMKRRRGAIVNIASVIGLMGNAGQANYAASKAGLLGFTKSTARELASRGIRCNAIAPGFIHTEMTAKLGDDVVKGLRDQIPMARLGDPDDVARVARFLAGPESAYITGQVIAVDGGMVM